MNAVEELAGAIRSSAPQAREVALRLTKQALDAGIHAEDVVEAGLIPAMADVGRRFHGNEIFVPEVLMSARAMQAALEVLAPILRDRGHQPVGRLLIGTVQGDIHDIGKNLVATMLEGAGFAVLDLGTDVTFARFDAAIAEFEPNIVAMSALLTTTMQQMRSNIRKWEASGRREDFAIMVGGAPLTDGWARAAGADGWAPDAAAAVEAALRLVRREVPD